MSILQIPGTNSKTVNLAVIVNPTTDSETNITSTDIVFANVGPIKYDDNNKIKSVGQYKHDDITGVWSREYVINMPHEFYISSRKDKHIIIKGCRCYGLNNETLYDVSLHSDLMHSDNIYNYDNMICWCNYGDNLYKIIYPEYPTRQTFKIWFRQANGTTPLLVDSIIGGNQHGFIIQMEFVY